MRFSPLAFSMLVAMTLSSNLGFSAPVSCEDYEQTHPFTEAEWRRDNSLCSGWTKIDDSQCNYKGKKAFLWERDCGRASPCAQEIVCLDVNPRGMKTACLDWWKDEGATCLTDAGTWEQHWSRTCTDIRLEADFCSDTQKP